MSLSHNHVTQWKAIEGSERNDIIQVCYAYVELKADIWLFRVG